MAKKSTIDLQVMYWLRALPAAALEALQRDLASPGDAMAERANARAISMVGRALAHWRASSKSGTTAVPTSGGPADVWLARGAALGAAGAATVAGTGAATGVAVGTAAGAAACAGAPAPVSSRAMLARAKRLTLGACSVESISDW